MKPPFGDKMKPPFGDKSDGNLFIYMIYINIYTYYIHGGQILAFPSIEI